MNILILCEEGNNRSVTLAHLLKYSRPQDDILTGGIAHLRPTTMAMLVSWADKVIVTDQQQYEIMRAVFSGKFLPKLTLCDIGPDNYPRPFNKELLKICRAKLPALEVNLGKDVRA